MMDGRVKTLHPKVHGGLLAIRDNAEHAAAAEAHGIAPIDLLVVNLYPFEATVAKGAAFDDCIENIDIGGPAMIRAAAKNHAAVTVVVDPEDYAAVLARWRRRRRHQAGAAQGAGRQGLRPHRRLRCGDLRLVRRRAGRDGAAPGAPSAAGWRRSCATARTRTSRPPSTSRGERAPGVATAEQLQGKELSYNNLDDTDAAIELVAEFDPERLAGRRHHQARQPVRRRARHRRSAEAYAKALRCDPVSAFGGIIALNRTLDAATARAITDIFTEVVIAPDATPEAKAIFAAKKNLRLLLDRRPARSARARADVPLARRRLPRAVARQRRGRRPAS